VSKALVPAGRVGLVALAGDPPVDDR